MEECASPPRWALDKKLGENASMEEKKEGERERVLKRKKRVNWEICEGFWFWVGFVIVLWSKKEANSSGCEPSFKVGLWEGGANGSDESWRESLIWEKLEVKCWGNEVKVRLRRVERGVQSLFLDIVWAQMQKVGSDSWILGGAAEPTWWHWRYFGRELCFVINSSVVGLSFILLS